MILLATEDIGDLGVSQYQREKRAKFRFSGELDDPAKVTVVMIFNNRGLAVKNREMQIVRV